MNNIAQNVLIGCMIGSTPILQGVKLSQYLQPKRNKAAAAQVAYDSLMNTQHASYTKGILEEHMDEVHTENAKQLVFAITNQDNETITYYSQKIAHPHTQISIPRDEHPAHSEPNEDVVSITTTPLLEATYVNDTETTQLLLKNDNSGPNTINTTYRIIQLQGGKCLYYPPLFGGIFAPNYSILSSLLQHGANPHISNEKRYTAADINSEVLHNSFSNLKSTFTPPEIKAASREQIRYRLPIALLLIEHNSPRPELRIRNTFDETLSTLQHRNDKEHHTLLSNSDIEEQLPYVYVYTAWMNGVDTAQSLYNIDPKTIQDKKPELPGSAQRYIACMQPITYHCNEIRKEHKLTDIDIFTTNEKSNST